MADGPLSGGYTVEELFGPLQGQVRFLEDPDTPTMDVWESF